MIAATLFAATISDTQSWGDCRGKSECRGECCGAVPGDLPRDCRGEYRETALLCSSQERAVSRHSPRQSLLGRSPGTAPQHSPRHSDFPRQSPQQSPQHFWGIRPRGFLWLASPISMLGCPKCIYVRNVVHLEIWGDKKTQHKETPHPRGRPGKFALLFFMAFVRLGHLSSTLLLRNCPYVQDQKKEGHCNQKLCSLQHLEGKQNQITLDGQKRRQGGGRRNKKKRGDISFLPLTALQPSFSSAVSTPLVPNCPSLNTPPPSVRSTGVKTQYRQYFSQRIPGNSLKVLPVLLLNFSEIP